MHAWFIDESAALAAIDALQQARARDRRFVRRAHGDLHLGNLCLWHGMPVPFDALEFDEVTATIDTATILPFLLMDIDTQVVAHAANRVLNRYVARTGDAGLMRGLPLFLFMRALVRAHVSVGRDHAGEVERYRARRRTGVPAAGAADPVGIGGLMGSGKSTLARALAAELGAAPGALVLRSDEFRKRLDGSAPEAKLPQTAYSKVPSEAVFAALAATARSRRSRTRRDRGRDIHRRAPPRHGGRGCADGRVRFLGLWLEAPLATLEARVAARRDDASDATIAVLHASSRSNPRAGDWVAIDATEAPATLTQARDAIRSLR